MLGLYQRVKKWERLKAGILSKSVDVHPRYSSSRAPFALNVKYTYTYQNKQYTGTKVYLAELAGGQVNHMKKTAELKMESIVDGITIYVNPAVPEESVIFCDSPLFYFVIAFLGILALLIGWLSF